MKTKHPFIVAVLILLIIVCFFGCSCSYNSKSITDNEETIAIHDVQAIKSAVVGSLPSVQDEKQSGAVRESDIVIPAITVSSHPVQSENIIFKKQPVILKTIQLHRVDFSGVYFLSEKYSAADIKNILLDGKSTTYTITENINIDVWESNLKSDVKAVIQIE